MAWRLSHSRLKAGRTCKRLHHYQYTRGLRPRVRAPQLSFGDVIHAGQEAWWPASPGLGDGRLRIALEAVQKKAAEVGLDAFDLVRAEELTRAHHFRWGLEDYEVLAVEAPFSVPLINPFTGEASATWVLEGKIDAIVRDRDGRVLLVEHKSSAEDVSLGSSYWRRLRLDSQVSIYFEGGAALGHDVAACLYNVLGKPWLKLLKATPVEKRRVKKDGTYYANVRLEDETPEQFRARYVEALAESPEAYLVRGEVVRLEDELRLAQIDVWQQAQELERAEAESCLPRNPDACFNHGAICPFYGVCVGEESLDNRLLFESREEREAKRVNAEQTQGGSNADVYTAAS